MNRRLPSAIVEKNNLPTSIKCSCPQCGGHDTEYFGDVWTETAGYAERKISLPVARATCHTCGVVFQAVIRPKKNSRKGHQLRFAWF